jgi:hypothetical protein
LPPLCYGDPWDEDFALAFEAIRPYLRKFRRDRFFPVPAGLPFGPLRAKFGHEALMYCLNPSRELYGFGWFLDTSEYRAIKAEAMSELGQRDKSRRVPWKTKDLPCSIAAHILGEIANLKGFVWDYHFPRKGEVVLKLLKLKDIQAKFGWPQSTATHRMQKWFKCKKAMKAYAKVFSVDAPVKGFRKRLKDATLDIEAICRERAADSEDDDSNGKGLEPFDE